MKILAVVPFPPPVTGLTVASAEAVRGLRKLPNAKVALLPFRGSAVKWLELPRLVRWADVVYLVASAGHGVWRDLIVADACARSTRPLIVHVHSRNYAVRHADDHLGRAMRRADALGVGLTVGHSQSLKAMFKSVAVVPNFAVTPVQSPYSKAEDPSTFNVLYLSNLMREKGYRALVEAVETLYRGGARIHLDVAGAGKSADLRWIRTKEGEAVEYHGFADLSKQQRLFARNQLFALPSFYTNETVPLTALDAAVHGLAVATTTTNYLSDVIDGVIELPTDPEGIATVLRQLIENPFVIKDSAARAYSSAARLHVASFHQALQATVTGRCSGA